MCSLCSRQILDCGDLFAIPETESCLANVQTLCHAYSCVQVFVIADMVYAAY